MFGEQVIHITPGIQTGVDRYGKPIFSDVSTPVDEVAVSMQQAVIDPQTGAITETTPITLYIRSGETAGPDDRFTVRGKTYKVSRTSSDWINPYSGNHPGNVVVLEDTEYVNGS